MILEVPCRRGPTVTGNVSRKGVHPSKLLRVVFISSVPQKGRRSIDTEIETWFDDDGQRVQKGVSIRVSF
jgi:hypothetical protein